MVEIIAEAGVNHNGSEETALDLVDVAKSVGADHVKFQIFEANRLASIDARQANYQIKATSGPKKNQREMLKALELDRRSFLKVSDRCRSVGIQFLASAFDQKSLQFLLKELGATTIKIASGEISNAPFLLTHAMSGARLILSTGMSTVEEIRDALSVLAFGMIKGTSDLPNSEAFAEAYASDEGQLALRHKVTLLHCTSEYPAPVEDVNLLAMQALREQFGLGVGYSDHTEGAAVSIAATALGAEVIEKHFTLDRSMDGPDHKASVDPVDFKEFVSSIRVAEIALGDGVKAPKPSELHNKALVRKSLYAARSIAAGKRFDEGDLTVMRPATGLSPFEYWRLLNSRASKDYEAGEMISE